MPAPVAAGFSREVSGELAGRLDADVQRLAGHRVVQALLDRREEQAIAAQDRPVEVEIIAEDGVAQVCEADAQLPC